MIGTQHFVFPYRVCSLLFSVPQVCRLAYELMQQYHADASDYATTLDDHKHYVWGHDYQEVALEAHTPRTSEEIELMVGDKIRIAHKQKHNYHSGYTQGRNLRSSCLGWYPSYKVEHTLRIVKMPTYPDGNKGNPAASLGKK